MNNQQLIWTSKTFWSAIIGALGAIVGIFKPNLLGSDQADQLAGAIAVLASFIGVLWGRQTADGSGGFKMLPCLLACVMLVGGGCASTPTKKWAQARDLLTVSQNIVLDQHAAGTISDAQLVQIDLFAKSARAALDQAATQLPQGGQSFESYMQIVQAALVKLGELTAPHAPNTAAPHAQLNPQEQPTHDPTDDPFPDRPAQPGDRWADSPGPDPSRFGRDDRCAARASQGRCQPQRFAMGFGSGSRQGPARRSPVWQLT